MSKCIRCHAREAVLPDRYSMSPRKKICRECHADRLKGDLKVILRAATGKGSDERAKRACKDLGG